jgi:hypothetical protein
MPDDDPMLIEQVLNSLAETPQRIAALTADLTPAQARTSPSPGEWSANEALAHLRSCGDVWGGCIARILAEDHPTIRAINPTAWIKQTDYPDLEFQPSLRAYLAQRDDLLAVLRPLPLERWARAALVTGGGAPRDRTVFFYTEWLARHERSHIRQFKQIADAMRGQRPCVR